MPPFIHWAQLTPQPPEATPAQLRSSLAAASHVPEAGRPNSCTTGAGADPAPDDAPPPPDEPKVRVSVSPPAGGVHPEGLNLMEPPENPASTVHVKDPPGGMVTLALGERPAAMGTNVEPGLAPLTTLTVTLSPGTTAKEDVVKA